MVIRQRPVWYATRMSDSPPAIEPPPDQTPAPAPDEPSTAPWIVLLAGVALLLAGVIALALIASPPNAVAIP